MERLGLCSVDLFASRLNNQLPRFVSWHPDPFAIETDAFQISWQEELGYAFPPFSLVGRCLQKVREESSTLVLIAPAWGTQHWYPLLLELLVDFPLFLPLDQSLLVDSFNREHPLLMKNQLQLAAWKVSRQATLQMEFQTELRHSSWRDGAKEPWCVARGGGSLFM